MQLSSVVKDFLTTVPDELCVSKGDVVQVVTRVDRIWCECRLLTGERQGKVPAGHLIDLQPPQVSGDQTLFIALSDFNGQQDGDLIFLKGEFIIGTHKIDDNWWHGKCCAMEGMFPKSYVLQLESEKSTMRQARVKTSMRAQMEEEIDLVEGDIVTVEKTWDKNYLYGCSQGKYGIFPAAFVTIIEDEEAEVELRNNQQADLPPAYRESFLPPKYEDSFTQLQYSPNLVPNEPSTSQSHPEMGMKPYGIGQYSFNASFDNELSFREGEVIMLINHVDDDWIKGSVDGREGIFPKSYINIVIDCPSSEVKQAVGLAAGGFARVVYDFQPQMAGDVQVKENDIVFLMNLTDDSLWWQVKKEDGTQGLCPSNFLEPLNLNCHAPKLPICSLAELEAKNLSELALSKPPVPSFPTSTRISWRPSPPSSPPPSPPRDEGDQEEETPPTYAVHAEAAVVPVVQSESIVRIPHRAPPPVRQYRTPPPVPQHQESNQSEPVAASHSRVDGHVNNVIENEEDIRKKMEEQRQNVITELVLTEKDFGRDLKITYETFNLYDPKHLEARGIDANLLFGNILEVIKVSEKLLDKLIIAMKGKSEDSQLIAPCFLEMSEDMKVIYTNYCTNNDNSLALLMKYSENEDIQRVFRKGIETLQLQVSCFDMSSIIIKPVQRIMKYPLILNELYKCTPETHQDKAGLLEAVKVMSEVASYINEAKRRQDIVSRYLGDGTSTFSSRMARFSFHSVAKKSSRLGAKLSSSLGMSNTVRDEMFEECARAFFSLDKHIKNFCRGVEIVLYQTKEVLFAQLNSSEAISDFFDDQTANNFEFRQAQQYISNELLSQFTSSLQKYVLEPLNAIMDLAIGPTKLIEKRNDKLADYEALLSKSEKLRDAKMSDDLNLAKNTYEALNTQLLEELPAFTILAEGIFVDCVMSYIRSRKIFSAKIAKKYLYLMELPVMAGFAREDPVGLFKVKHNMVCDEMNNKLSFMSRNFKAENFGTMRSNSNSSSTKTSPFLSAERKDDRTQSPSRKSFLLSKYALNTVYKVTQTWNKSEVLDLTVQEGDIVAVIKKQDPMGSTERWYADDGENKGFVPQKCLQQYLNSSPLSSGYGDGESDRTYEEVDYASTDKEEDIYEELPEYDFYFADYNFDPINESTLKMLKGQVLKVLAKNDRQGNNEWWYVENRDGEHGYVPASYLKKYSTQDSLE